MKLRVRAALVGAVVAGMAVSLGVAGSPASAGSNASVNVAVLPGFNAPIYSGAHGIPTFPTGAAGLSGYHFSELSVSSATSTALQSYDTLILYGLRWNTLPQSAQSAINTFAQTGKVLIWDADSTGAQDYSSFLHPFSTSASGETGVSAGSVVTFVSGTNPLASSDPSSSQYLNPSSLVASTHLIGHMSVMNSGATDWAPGLIAANSQIPGGGWVLAWGYGKTGDHTGLVVYSGIDADAFHDQLSPNYALKELGIELAAPFSRTADSSCAPNCSAPSVGSGGVGSGGGSGGGGSGGGGSGGSGGGSGGVGGTSFAQCSLDRKAPTSWVRGRVPLYFRTSVAANLSVRVITRSGKVVGSGLTVKPGHLKFIVNTRQLPSNRTTTVFAVVYVNGKAACRVSAGLKVDNVPPRLLQVNAKRLLQGNVLRLRVSEASHLSIVVGGRTRHFNVKPGVILTVSLPASATSGKLVLVDRAGNRVTRIVRW